MKRLSFQEKTKRRAGCCFLCGEADYAVLHCHRIVPGEDGGCYTEKNTVVLCANCHNKTHDGQVVFFGRYTSTAARWVTHYKENNQEHWR
jgi:hypothetical protein